MHQASKIYEVGGKAAPSDDEAVTFLQHLRPDGPWVLTTIIPDGRTLTITARTASEVRDFIREHNGKRNLYYSCNPTRTAMTSKAKKVDIAAVEYLLADLDPGHDESSEAAKARYLETLDKDQHPPTAIVDSGNGIQCLWRLDSPIPLPEPTEKSDAKGKTRRVFSPETSAVVADVEARTAAHMEALGSVAGTQNIDRILRLPGTTNLPNNKKIKEGRTQCQTKLIRFETASYSLEAFPLPEAVPQQSKKTTADGRGAELVVSALPVSKRILDLIKGIDDPEHHYSSRSERVMAVLVALAGAECSDEVIAAIMFDERLPIGEHIREKSEPQKYLDRQITQARKMATDADVAELNKTYALVLVGDKPAVMKETPEGPRFLTIAAFNQWFANRRVRRGGNLILLAKHWLSHPQRRQYEGIVFSPGCNTANHFNLWRGFAVEPRSGECSKFLAHIKDNVCNGDANLYEWVIGWFAQMFQHPDKKPGTSLVIRGKQGTGKTKIGDVVGSLLGDHYAAVSDPRYVTGQFNSHLVSCLLLHCDEAFWAGDRAAEGKLKDLVTGDYQFIEYKGKEPIRLRSYLRLFVTGNPDWLVPAGFEERRFAVLEIGEDHMRDHDYFAAIDDEMNNGGREALLEHLLNFDLSKVNMRRIPTTAALLDQKIASLSPEKAWWMDVLNRGILPGGSNDANCCPTQGFFDDYIGHANKTGIRRRSIETQIGQFLRKHVPGLSKRSSETGMIYQFPPLGDCRDAFTKMLQQDREWDEPLKWVKAGRDGVISRNLW